MGTPAWFARVRKQMAEILENFKKASADDASGAEDDVIWMMNR